MNALGVYICLLAATVISVLISLSASPCIRAIRSVTVLLSYVLLVALFVLDPWWRVLAISGGVGLATGLLCFAVDRFWNQRGRKLQPELPASNHAWLIPLGIIGWPDMLPQLIEFALFDYRVFPAPSRRPTHDDSL